MHYALIRRTDCCTVQLSQSGGAYQANPTPKWLREVPQIWAWSPLGGFMAKAGSAGAPRALADEAARGDARVEPEQRTAGASRVSRSIPRDAAAYLAAE